MGRKRSHMIRYRICTNINHARRVRGYAKSLVFIIASHLEGRFHRFGLITQCSG